MTFTQQVGLVLLALGFFGAYTVGWREMRRWFR
jgi:hypothetical protein